MKYILIVAILLNCSCKAKSQYNFGFEHLDKTNTPVGWGIGKILDFGLPKDASTNNWYVDSSVRFEGEKSLCLTYDPQSPDDYISCGCRIPVIKYGHKIKITGYIKTENVQKGHVGLWLRIDSNRECLAFNNMSENGITGTNDWKQYSIELNYNSRAATNILVGGILQGKGKMWIDKLEVFFDGNNLETINLDNINPKAFKSDTTSDTKEIRLTPLLTDELFELGETWSFLKYYHPDVVGGKYDMDDELFKVLPSVINCKNKEEFNIILQKWVEHFGKLRNCTNCVRLVDSKNIKQLPDTSFINKLAVPTSFRLKNIFANRDSIDQQYYVKLSPNGNPVFLNENPFDHSDFPDVGIRLLALYRYWAMVKYFYPYRYLITDWDSVLKKFIPYVVSAKNRGQYAMVVLKLIGEIGDSHADLISNSVWESIKGYFILPITATFVKDSLVITNYLQVGDSKSNLIEKDIRIGDVILKLNDTPITNLVNTYLRYTPGSNIHSRRRNLLNGGLLFRYTSNSTVKFEIKRKDVIIVKYISPLNINNIRPNIATLKKGYEIINSNIGYIKLDKINEADFLEIKDEFKSTKGIILDLRTYPLINIPYTFGNWIKNYSSPFAILSKGSVNYPGLASLCDTMVTGGAFSDTYTGKVIVLVNEITQSAAEFGVMALQSSKNTIVIGSTTAGADGNVSQIILPGKIKTAFSGLGVYYPNGDETQRIGVKINYNLIPRISSIINTQDDLLDKAIQLIE